MSQADPALSAGAVRLALGALEAPLARISPAAIKRFAADAARLSNAGIVKAAGHEPVTTASDDFSDAAVALTWDQERGGFGYFSCVDGWRDVPQQALSFYEVDVPRFLATITHKCDIVGKISEVIPSHLWDLGLIRLRNRPRRIPIMFGRRLQDAEVARDIETLCRKRPSPERRVILTSTKTDLLSGYRACTVISIQDALACTAHLEVDPTIIALRYDQIEIVDPEAPLVVLRNGMEVRLMGQTFQFKRGIKQRAIVCYMYDKYLKGQRWTSSAEIAVEVQLADSTRLRDVFKGNQAWGKLIVERDGMCAFCLPDLRF